MKRKGKEKGMMTSHYDIIQFTSQISFFKTQIIQKRKNIKSLRCLSWFCFVFFSWSFFCCFFVFVLFFSATMQTCKKTTRYFNRYNAHTIKRLRVCTFTNTPTPRYTF